MEITAFWLVLTRVTSFFMTLPFFSYRNIPNRFKIGIAFILSWLMYVSMELPAVQMDGTYVLLILKEILVGIMLGLIATIIMGAVKIAGGFIDFQMGFAIANVMDPQTGAQSPLIGSYYNIFAILLLFAVNGHHLLLDGVFYSYQFVPIEQVSLNLGDESFVAFVVKMFSTMFLIAFQLSLPVVGILFLVDTVLGFMGKAVPQLNIFVVGYPIKITISFIFILLTLPIFIMLMRELFETMIYVMRGLMDVIGGTRE
ncbi:flagellar biosynthetic protein FliR (plasmid) [Rossellomorea sp. AcN35-11]|nr:flagellar type III secretion system protein FliR [Rossellomorea aquimaris]WJV32296.1 flagellar biosynthetic protein FliR [Rossellomorea sp. AcN35-11]